MEKQQIIKELERFTGTLRCTQLSRQKSRKFKVGFQPRFRSILSLRFTDAGASLSTKGSRYLPAWRYYQTPGETEIGSAEEQPVKGYPGACATNCRWGDALRSFPLLTCFKIILSIRPCLKKLKSRSPRLSRSSSAHDTPAEEFGSPRLDEIAPHCKTENTPSVRLHNPSRFRNFWCTPPPISQTATAVPQKYCRTLCLFHPCWQEPTLSLCDA